MLVSRLAKAISNIYRRLSNLDVFFGNKMKIIRTVKVLPYKVNLSVKSKATVLPIILHVILLEITCKRALGCWLCFEDTVLLFALYLRNKEVFQKSSYSKIFLE